MAKYSQHSAFRFVFILVSLYLMYSTLREAVEIDPPNVCLALHIKKHIDCFLGITGRKIQGKNKWKRKKLLSIHCRRYLYKQTFYRLHTYELEMCSLWTNRYK